MKQRRLSILVIAAASLLGFAGDASAQTIEDGSSAVDEYVEDVPTSEGSTPVVGNKPKKRKPLSSRVTAEVHREGGEDAAVLEEVATSSAFGAPQKEINRPRREKPHDANTNRPAERPQVGSSGGEALAAAATATTGENASRLIALLIALGVISVATVATLVARQPRRSP